jgi:hypothetical protein
VTRTAAVAVDLGIVIIALGVTYLGVFAFLFLLAATSPLRRRRLGWWLPSAACCSPSISG